MFEKQVKYSVFRFLPTVAGTLALFLPIHPVARGFLALIWLAGSGHLLGLALLPTETRSWRTFLGTLAFAAGTTVAGAAVYFVLGLGIVLTTLLVAGSALTTAGWAVRAERHRLPFGTPADAFDDFGSRWSGAALLRALAGTIAMTAVLALLHYGTVLLSAAAVDGAVRSPWDAAQRIVFLLFFLAAALTFMIAHGELSPGAAILGGAMLAAFMTSVAAVVYEIGFGFDPFLHRATEQMIFTEGAVWPKPFYYLGQYAAVTITARLLGGHVAAVDLALVPVALALVIPTAYWSLRRAFDFPRGQAAAAALAVLALPLASFAATTPQGFANALFLMTVFLALPAAVGRLSLLLPALLALATASVHPLGGIPLLLFVAILAALRPSETRRSGWKTLLPWIIALAGTTALPLIFLLNSLVSGAGVTIDAEAARASGSLLDAFQGSSTPTRRYDLYLDFTYGWKATRAWAIFAAAAAGLALLRSRGGAWLAWALGALVCFGNFALLKTLVQFPFLISYERSSYADRLFELALFLAAPLTCAAVAWTLVRLRGHLSGLRLFATVLAAALLTSSLYLAYPRRDQYEASRGWSTSASDVAAVQSIDQDAAGEPYVVLANQSVSAAAVREFGFRRYYESHDAAAPGPVFFYPIPTGGPLYERFLAMNEARGARAEAIKAMDLAGVDLAYYVVSYYWWDAQRINVTAKNEADRDWAIDSDDFVFRYER